MTAEAAQLHQSLQKSIDLMGRMQSAVVGFGAGLSFHGLASGVERGLSSLEHFNDQIVEFKHSADTLGISIEKVATLKAAAGDKWEGVQAGLGKMVKTLGEARFGSEEAAKGFQLLGLNVKELSGMKTEAVLGIIADKMKGIENPTERAYVASLIFKKGWVEMMPILEKGSAGIEEFGTSVDKFGKITSKAGEDALMAKEAIHELREAWDGLGRAIAMKVSGLSRDLAEFFENFRHAKEMLNLSFADDDKRAEELAKHAFILADIRGEHRKSVAAIDPLATQEALDAKLAKQKELEQQEKDAAKVREQLQKEANKLIEDAQTPWEKLNSKIAEANDLLMQGFLNAEQFDNIMGSLGDKLLHAEKIKEDFGGSGALEAGATGAFSAQERFLRESEGGKDTARDTLAELRAVRAASDKTQTNTKAAADALKKLGVAKF